MNEIIAQYKQWIKDSDTLTNLDELEFRAGRTWDQKIPTELKNLFAEKRDKLKEKGGKDV